MGKPRILKWTFGGHPERGVRNYQCKHCSFQILELQLAWSSSVGYGANLPQYTGGRTCSNRTHRNARRGWTVDATVSTLLHLGSLDRRSVPGYRNHVSTAFNLSTPTYPKATTSIQCHPLQCWKTTFILEHWLIEPRWHLLLPHRSSYWQMLNLLFISYMALSSSFFFVDNVSQ